MEKRVSNRVMKRVMVKFGTEKADKTGFTKNLSVTGICIKTNSVMKPGTTLQVDLKFPDRLVSLWARVVWAKKVPAQLAHVLDCGMGLHFIDPPDDWADYLSRWETGA